MNTFDEWVKENHPEYYDENFWKKLAIGGALAGSALGATGMGAAGVGGYMLGKNAGQQSPQQQTQQAQQQSPQQPTHPLGSYYAKERERNKADMKNKQDQLKAKGLKSGRFVHGKLVEPGDNRDGYDMPYQAEEIPTKSYTSPDASKFFPSKSKKIDSKSVTSPDLGRFLDRDEE